MPVRSTALVHGHGRWWPQCWPAAPNSPPSFPPPPHAALTIEVETSTACTALGVRFNIVHLITAGAHWHSRPPVDLQVRYRVVSATANTGMLARH